MSHFNIVDRIEDINKNLEGDRLPVYIKDRDDLISSVKLADQFYNDKTTPYQADYGVFLSDGKDFESLFGYLSKLVKEWINLEELNELDGDQSVLVCGIYKDLTYKKLEKSLFHWKNSDLQISFLTGRDLCSLSWVLAKQFVTSNDSIRKGFFTSEDVEKIEGDIEIYDWDDCEEKDIQSIILESSWKSLVFQGHGKDDSINLAEYTICGLNETVGHTDGKLRPRCGYCDQICYKDDQKLIPLNKIKTEEITLSACNSAPLADLGLYDEKYLLLLLALDGVAKSVCAGLTVHDSSLPENTRWLNRKGLENSSSAHFFNKSLVDRHPYPSFWEFGVKGLQGDTENFCDPKLSNVLINAIDRAQSFLVNDFLNAKHPIRNRLSKFSYKFNQSTTRERRVWNTEFNDKQISSLMADIESLDFAYADMINKDPENDLMNFEGYFADRSNLDKSSAKKVKCSCGNNAVRYNRKGLYSQVIDTEAEICFRCGDKKFFMQNAPDLEITSDYIFNYQDTIKAIVEIETKEKGRVNIGYFLPGYLRDDLETTPTIIKKKMNKGDKIEIEIEFKLKQSVQAQAYYFTVYAVQNLAISTCRQHFGLEKL